MNSYIVFIVGARPIRSSLAFHFIESLYAVNGHQESQVDVNNRLTRRKQYTNTGLTGGEILAKVTAWPAPSKYKTV